MSRRTRIKHFRAKQRFSVNHHAEYSTSSSYFPRSYSILGSEISFPVSILPFYYAHRINFAGQIENFFIEEKKHLIQYGKLEGVFISLKGEIVQRDSKIVTNIFLILSVLCFCLYWIFKMKFFRNRIYTKYKFQHYEQMMQIVKKAQQSKVLVINFQDNAISCEKIRAFDKVLVETEIKDITIRNMSYHIEVEDQDKLFTLIRNKKDVKFKFIWENMILESSASPHQEEQSLLTDFI